MEQLQKINRDIWLRVKEVANLQTVSPQFIRKRCAEGFYLTRLVTGNGGMQYLISLTSLPADVQIKYFEEKCSPVELPKETVDSEAKIYSELTTWEREYVDKFVKVLKETEGLKGNDLKNYLAKANIKGLSYGNFMKRRQAYQDNGIAGLLPNWGKSEGKSIIDDEDFEYFKSLYLQQSKPALHECWTAVLGQAIKRNLGEVPENFPNETTFYRRLFKEVDEQAIVFARDGKKKWYKTYANYVNRDYADIKAGQVWISDHRQLDIATIEKMPDSEDKLRLLRYFEKDRRINRQKPVFPWATVWIDYKTGYWLSWNLHAEAPNSDHILETFFMAAEKYGIPEHIYIDNGKDYRCRDFAGGRPKNVKVEFASAGESAMQILGIKVHYALPYNAQSKIIERSFRDMKYFFDKQIEGYRGGNIIERPEKLLNEVKAGKVNDVKTVEEMLDYFVVNILSEMPLKKAKNSEGGKTRAQLWAEQYKGLPKVSPDSMMLLCARTSAPKTIKRNGILINWENRLYYWADWMSAFKGTRVYMRRQPKKYQEAWVFEEGTNRYLGKAFFDALGANALATTDITRQQLSQVLAQKKREEKAIRDSLPTGRIPGREILENTAIALAALQDTGTTGTDQPVNTMVKKTVMDDVATANKIFNEFGTIQPGTLKLFDDRNFKKEEPKIFLFPSEKEKYQKANN